MNGRLIAYTVALLAVSALAFIAIGLSYTASTENSGNTVASEYVVLEQNNYNFTLADGVKFDIVSSDLGVYYQLRDVDEIEPKIDGAKYYGMKVSTDKLRATVSGAWSGKVSICTPQIDGTWFTDYCENALDWRYIMKVEGNGVTQYAYYAGETPDEGQMVTWKVIKKVDSVWTYGDSQGEFTELDIVKDVEYSTTLYYAGVGTTVNDGSFTRTIGRTIHLTDSAVIRPVWTVAGEYDVKNTIMNYDSEAAAAAAYKTYSVRQLYFERGGNIILPINQFITDTNSPLNNGKVFAGWWNEERQKTYYVRYVFTADKDYVFSARWADVSECTTFTFDVNMPDAYESQYGVGGKTDDTITMANEYLLKGGYYALPANKFDLTGYRFVGWKVGADDTVYQPGYADTIPYSTNSVTIKAQWEPWDSSTSPYKKITFDGEVNFEPYKLVVHTDANGNYILPENILGPEFEIPSEYSTGWKFEGWSIQQTDEARTGKIVAQSYTMPAGIDNTIINNGTIKFIYISDPGGS